MVDFDSALSGADESSMKHHPLELENLTSRHYLAEGHWQPVSFTGAVSSQRVTEDYEGSLGPVGNRAIERMSIRELYCETYKSSSCESRFK